jgi:hypothetical protein
MRCKHRVCTATLYLDGHARDLCVLLAGLMSFSTHVDQVLVLFIVPAVVAEGRTAQGRVTQNMSEGVVGQNE